MASDTENASNALMEMTTEIVAAYVAGNKLTADQIPALIQSVFGALGSAGAPAGDAPAQPEKLTAAQIRKSIRPEGLISFEDGKSYKTLKRHLTTRGLTLEQYRAKWGLPKDYPTTSANYSAARSEMAKTIGLGRKAAAPAAEPAPAAKPGRRKKAT